MVRFLLLTAATLFAAASNAQMYKCVDSAGKVTYSQDLCPKNTRSQPVKSVVSTVPASQPAAKGGEEGAAKGAEAKKSGPKSAADLDKEFRERRQKEEEERKKAEEKSAQAAAKAENCRAARANLAQLESGMRQIRINEQGERNYLDDAQIEQEKARARTAVNQWCN